MKKWMFALAMVLLLATFYSAQAGSLQGKWTGEAKPRVYDDWCQGAPEMQFTIKADGTLKGSASDEDGNRMRLKGAVKDGKIDIDPISTPIGTIKFITVEEQTDSRVSGTWKANRGCGGTWFFEKKK